MGAFRTTYSKDKRRSCAAGLVVLALLVSFCAPVTAQECPPNIDFETGTFDGWTCYTGTTAAVDNSNVISLNVSGPVFNRHTMYTRSANVELDPYGNFPVVCPNGSGHSIRLGNNSAGTEAEGVSYEFTIPANRNTFSLIYHYAVVFQDPHHQDYQQPRMVAEVNNLTDRTLISCSSFTFFPYGTPLPGFFMSQNQVDDIPVWCKDWSAVTINLNNLAGKTIQLFFKTADCTFRRHFGYAYIDVNTECSSEFTGALFCRGDSAVQVMAPYGYEKYTWYNAGFSQVIGNHQALNLSPAPQAGTTIAVQITPYNGYGCVDTLYARLMDTLTVQARAGPDQAVCPSHPVQLGSPPRPGILYSWSPSAGLTDGEASNPFANPSVPTTYVLTCRNYGGGCRSSDTVTVTPVITDPTIRLIGREAYCIGSGDSSILQLGRADTIQWFRDNQLITGAWTSTYRVTQSGTYYAKLYQAGCVVSTASKSIVIARPEKGISYPVVYAPVDNAVSLRARPLGDTILWQPGTALDNARSRTPLFRGAADQAYTIAIRNAAGCLTVDTQVVKIVSRIDILVPTAFTPNGDGRNDILRPFLYGIKELRYFRVYNRWGELLYDGNSAGQGWDGTHRGQPQGTGAVVWVAEGVGIDGKTYFRKGTAVCVR